MKKNDSKWLEFEYYSMNFHINKYNHKVWHQSIIPEDELYKAGFINDFNRTRLNRLAILRESKNNSVKYGDYGMDFLAYDSITGIYHACQSKCYSGRNKVTIKDIATFQSIVMNRFKTLGYLYTFGKLEINLQEDLLNGGFIVHNRLLNFTGEIKSIENIDEIKYELRLYQKEAIQAILGEGRKSIEIACGLGKTLIAGHVLKESDYKKIICIAPLRVSVEQLQNRIMPFLDNKYKSLLVDTEGTTDIDIINKNIEDNEYLIIFSTYKSAQDLLNEIVTGEEYLIVDEVHNALNMGEFVNKFENCLLMSATIPEELYEIIEDVDNVFTYGIAEAIQNKYICDYEVHLPYIDNGVVEVSENFPGDAKVEFLITGMLKTGSRRCIVYLSSCSECEPFMNMFKESMSIYHGICKVWCEKIDNTVNSKDRTIILNKFQNDKDNDFYIIASVRILDEAIDISKCDSEFIIHVGEQSSDIRTVQRLQRGGRLDLENPMKKNNLFMWCEDWSKAINTLTLLKNSDIDFHKKINIINPKYNENSNIDKKKIVNKKIIELKNYISIQCLNFDERWEIKYKLLKEFIKENNRIPNCKEEYKNIKIGSWCNVQRKKYKKQILDDERIQKLEEIKIWKWGEKKISKKLSWDENYKILLDFIKENNRIPKKIEEYKDIKIGIWCTNQKKSYNKNKLDNERIKKLEEVKIWKWGEKEEVKIWKWGENYKILLDFIKENNRIPKAKEEHNNIKIGAWCSKKRQLYNKNKLDNERIKKLEKIIEWYW